jgi:hypothetical protein
MTPEERSLLQSTHELAEENNKILHGIRRANRFNTIMRVVYWVLIIGFSFGAYYLIQPYIALISGLYGQGANTLNSAQDTVNSLKDLLK